MRAQRGITLMGFLMVLVVVGFFAFVGFKLFPVYAEYYAVRTDMAAIAAEPGSATMDVSQVRSSLDRRFNISYVESVDLKKDVTLIRDTGGNKLNIKYEVRRPLIYNLDFVAKFDHTVPMSSRGTGE